MASMMTRLSVWLATEKAMRDGTLALMTPVMTFTEGRCVAITKMNADSSGHLSDTNDRVFHLTPSHHHEIVELVDDDHEIREPVEAVGIKIASGQFLAISSDVAHSCVERRS